MSGPNKIRLSGWRDWSIRGKLFSLILLVLVLNILILLLVGSYLFEQFYVHNKISDLKSSARRIIQAYEQNSEAFYDEIRQIENQNAVVSLLRLDEDGRPEFTYNSRANREGMRPENRPDMPPPDKEDLDRFEREMSARIARTGDGMLVETASFDDFKNNKAKNKLDDSMLTLSVRLSDGFYLYMETPRNYIRSTADLAVKYTAWLSVGILLVGAVVLYFLVGRMTRPIRSIQHVADKIAGLNFSESCDVRGGDEIAKLGVSINHMSRELESSIEKLVDANQVLQNDLLRQQQTDRMRREFIANVSHDFKTPLTLIISYAEALAAECGEEKAAEFCEIIIGEGNRLSGMVGRLLNLSKLESGVDKLEKSIFCLDEVLDQVLASHRVLMEKKEITLEKSLESGLIVNADYQKIDQAVMNLVDNAVKYSPPGGTVRVSAIREGTVCRVAVENTGRQIAPDDIENLFDSFYRADKSRKADGQSYGLGLAIVRAVMQAHEMPYGVENLPDGVRFWFQLEYCDLDEEE